MSRKKRIQETLAVMGTIILIIIGCSYVSYNDTHYTRTGSVVRVDSFCYRLTDVTGHSFDFYANDILKDGTKVTATLDNKGTFSYVYDDEIIDYKTIFDSED